MRRYTFKDTKSDDIYVLHAEDIYSAMQRLQDTLISSYYEWDLISIEEVKE
jgi:hypothetical protein